MKKKLIATMLVAMMTISMAACGTNSKTNTSSNKSADNGASTEQAATQPSDSGSKKPLEVVIWDTNQQKGIQQICDEFTAKSGIPVKVEVKDWDSYWTLLESGASGGNMPDVFWMHSNNSQMYMKNGVLLNLDKYIANSKTIDMSKGLRYNRTLV
jgi:multiple sugar transport system substrate-binding protein